MPQHFAAPPQWEWYIVWYFFLGGISGGVYVLGTLLRLFGSRTDAPMARLAFLVSLPALVLCPVFLTLDLGHPLRFWHMLIDARTMSPSLKYWSPMSVGAWVLLIFGVFSLVSFLEALGSRAFLSGPLGRLFVAVGAFFGLFLAGYTGILLSVSNQPIWSDTWALGGLFLASGLSVAAATLALAARAADSGASSEAKLARADFFFTLLELVLLVAFFMTLGAMASRLLAPRLVGWWVLVGLSILAPLAVRLSRSRGIAGVVIPALVLIGGLALRVVVIFGAQA
ncbi:MAG TPA: NrfD/PsrC family molybdoenzyme membrane anchor subunit [Candidatus Methylomirabilis sp.]|nr:NrfD/PsrC family molybdoenzyme membrane anchor subunit [Candidatus Methylomirabilis sp.]